MPYTPMELIARTHSSPISGSQTCRLTVRSPTSKVPPKGMTANVSIATMALSGADEYTTGRRCGAMSSLKKSLAPSATVCRIPNGPSRLGPIRDCILRPAAARPR
jgi:hypothetical protein